MIRILFIVYYYKMPTPTHLEPRTLSSTITVVVKYLNNGG